MKAYKQPAYYGTDERFRVAEKNEHGHNKGGMPVVISRVRVSDLGKYCCGIDKGTDWYETFNTVVSKPAAEPVKPLVEPAFKPATGEEIAWMGNEGAGKEGMNSEVRKAMMKCQGNKACTLAPLQREELEINTSC